MALIEIAKKIGSQMGKSLMKEKIKKNSQGEEEMANVIPQFQQVETKEEEMAEPLNVKKGEVESDEMHKEGMSKEDMKKAWEEKQNMLKSKKDKYIYKKVGEGAVEKIEKK
jgi:hypothetical protein